MVSRIGKLPIKVADDIKVDITGSVVTLKKGNKTKTYDFGSRVKVLFENKEIFVKEVENDTESVKFSGLHRSNLHNIVKGLTEGFKITLEYNGVGYKAAMVKNYLILTLGYSHDIAIKIPENVKATPEKPNLIILESDDKEVVGTIASRIISLRKPEPYKGKGIKYQGQEILRKEGKKK